MGLSGALSEMNTLAGVLSPVGNTDILPIDISENGIYEAPKGSAYTPITVDVEPSLQSKSRTYTPLELAQTETITADSGYYGLNGVDITVAAIQTETKTTIPQGQIQQVIPSTGKYLKEVTVEAIDSHYIGSAIDRRTDIDVTVDGATVSTPNGYYATGVTKSVQAGAEGVPQVVLGAVTNNAVEVTPTVTNIEGYIAGSTKTGSSVTVAASDLVSGTEDISENGVYNITNKASVNVVVPQPSGTKQISIIQNGVVTEDVEDYEDAEISVNVPNTYTSADEGKVVSNGSLVGQTSRNITANGTVDTTLNNEVVVAVPNSYTQADEGKVVSSGALVEQTSTTKTQNGTYDTTLNNEVVVNVPYSCIGKNPTLLRTELKPKVYLKDTDFATWTPSTTLTIIVPTDAEFTFEADMPNYDYMLCIQFYVHLYYDDGAQQRGMFIEGSSESWSAMYRYPSNYAQLIDYNWNANGSNPAIQTVSSTHYYAANGGETVVNSLAYGVTCNVQMPTVSSTTGADNPTWTVKSPNIQARCHDSYFNPTNAGYVNQNTSYYQLKYTLYRVDYGTCPFRFAQDRKNDILINHGIE